MRGHVTSKNWSEARRDQVLVGAQQAEVVAEAALVLERPVPNSTREWPAVAPTRTSNAMLPMECSTIVHLHFEWNQLSLATKSFGSLLCQALSDLQLPPLKLLPLLGR